jgi:acyl-CoA synthetase (AMP-forming)/AMP-acid ligase II
VPDVETVPDLFSSACASTPDRPFLIFTQGDGSHTYEQAARLIDRAAAVWHHLGVRRGDRVAFLLDNRPLFVWAWLGLARLGGILVAVNTGFRSAEADYLVTDSGSGIALVGTEYAGVVTATTVLDEDQFTGLMAAGLPAAPAAVVEGDDVISLIYTSGTTGRPKGVMQTHRNYVRTGQRGLDADGRRRPDLRVPAAVPHQLAGLLDHGGDRGARGDGAGTPVQRAPLLAGRPTPPRDRLQLHRRDGGDPVQEGPGTR